VENDEPVDLRSRIGSRASANAPRADDPATVERLDGPIPPRRDSARPFMIGAQEPAPSPVQLRPEALPAEDEAEEPKSAAIPSPRTPPGPGEVDLVVTPLPTPDDWHRFELALRRVRGVGQLRTEYYRHGVLKVRVGYIGSERLGTAMRAGLPGYRVRVIGEDRSTLQILVSTESDERRPG